MKVRLTDRWIYIIAVINAIFLIIKYGVDIEFDTTSYIAAWDNSWSKGIIDIFRTPIYPIFLGTLRSVFGNNFMLAVIIVQHFVFLISIYYFKLSLSWNVNSHTVVQWITLVYALLPATSTWANCILTESFAISGIVFLFYNLFSCLHNKKISYTLWVTFWLFILLMLRPAFLYLIPALIIAWLLLIKTNKRLAIIGIAGVCIVGCIEFGYCNLFKERYGIFTPSCVSIYNQQYLAFQDSLMVPTFTNNCGYQQYITEYNGKEIPASSSINDYGLITVSNAIHISQQTYTLAWIKHAFMRFGYALTEPLLSAHGGSITLKNFFGLSINIAYIFIITYLIILVYQILHHKKLRITSLILWITVVGNLITVIIGAQNSWGRLLLPSLPLFIIMFGQAFNYIKFNINGNTKETQIE